MDSGGFFQNPPDFVLQDRVIQVNVSHLVIRHGKNPAGATIEKLPSKLLFDRQPARLAKYPVQMHRPIHFGDAVLGEQDDLHVASLPNPW